MMIFQVQRTSIYEGKPCEEAEEVDIIRVDVRSVDDPAKVPAKLGQTDWWYQDGRNHRVENGNIMRDFDGKMWSIKLKTLKDLTAFVEKYGAVVIQPSYLSNGVLCIEIYDDYRE